MRWRLHVKAAILLANSQVSLRVPVAAGEGAERAGVRSARHKKRHRSSNSHRSAYTWPVLERPASDAILDYLVVVQRQSDYKRTAKGKEAQDSVHVCHHCARHRHQRRRSVCHVGRHQGQRRASGRMGRRGKGVWARMSAQQAWRRRSVRAMTTLPLLVPRPRPSCLMTLDESRFERAAGAKIDVTGHTLILPCVSIGSVPQLAIDALLEPSNSTAIFGRPGQLISTLDHRFCVPFVGGLQRGYASSTSADERIQGPLRVYSFEEAKVTIVQQRSPIVKVRVVTRFLHLPLALCTLTPGHSHRLARKTLHSSSLHGSHKKASPTSLSSPRWMPDCAQTSRWGE